jgi:hypothetical protein
MNWLDNYRAKTANEHRDPTNEIGIDIVSGWAGNFLLVYEKLSADDGPGDRERHSSAQRARECSRYLGELVAARRKD